MPQREMPGASTHAFLPLCLLAHAFRLVAPEPRVAEPEGCTDTCSHPSDGECDDGGAGSHWSLCGYGTDCVDCGVRDSVGDAGSGSLPPQCPWGNRDDLCLWSGDGHCDDGGPGAEYGACAHGTDLQDCGERPECGESVAGYCHWFGDGVCDDGGPGAEFFACDFGTDELDCGERRGPAPPVAVRLPYKPPNADEQCARQHAQNTVAWVSAALWSLILVLWIRILAPRMCCIWPRPAAATTAQPTNSASADSASADSASPIGDSAPAGSTRVKRSCTLVHPWHHPLPWVMLVVPFFHLGHAAWTLYAYTMCDCLVCAFSSYSSLYAFLATSDAFSIGRLSALLLCLWLIATGCGTIHAQLGVRNWFLLVCLFGGFIACAALGSPITVSELQLDSDTLFVGECFTYLLIMFTTSADAWSNSRVLKAQLVMIREQGIDPRTCPAWHKFQLFTALRRALLIYFGLHALVLASQSYWKPPLSVHVTLVVAWELVQLGVTAAIGSLFHSSSTTESGLTHLVLDREIHLPSARVVRHVDAAEVSLDGLDLDHAPVLEDTPPSRAESASAESVPLVRWQHSTAVPAPPSPPPLISLIQLPRRRRRRQPPPWPRQHVGVVTATPAPQQTETRTATVAQAQAQLEMPAVR